MGHQPWRRVIGMVGVLAIVIAIVPAAAGVAAARKATPDRPNALTVTGIAGPVGVDPDGVVFAWHVVDSRRGARQTGYRILVARRATTDARSRDVVWDSGTVSSAQQAFVNYGGPPLAAATEYWWTVATHAGDGASGPFARPEHFVTGLRNGDWQAQWVRPGPAQLGPDQYTYVRKDVRLAKSPIVRATAYVAAAHKYQLWINDALADTGPSFSYPDEQYYQGTDITRRVRAGAVNALGVLHHWYGAGQGRPESRPGLLMEIVVVHRDGTREVIGSDGTWREHSAEWRDAPLRNDEGDFVEHIDGRATPTGWAKPGFNAHSWSPVAVLGPAGTPPFTHLVAQRSRIVEQSVRPVSVRRLASGAVVADYGVIVAATPTVSFRHGKSGRKIAMHAGFLLDPDGSVSTTRGTQDTDMSYSYVERAGKQTFRPYTYLGFRYLQVDAPHEELSSDQLVAYARHAAMPDLPAARFTSSNSTLDAVFRLTARSALFASQEQFVDTPTREKGAFLGDGMNDSLTTMHAFGEQNVTWQALHDFANSQARYWPDGRINAVYPNGDGARDIPDGTEAYPDWLWQYYLETGDRTTLAALYPVVARVADYVWRAVDPTTGLVTRLPGGLDEYLYGIVDWPPAMRYGYDMQTVVRTTVNDLAVNVFDREGQMAGLLGRADEAGSAQNRRGVVTNAINARLARPDGVYIDGLEADGSQSTHASQQANALALAFGIVPAERIATVGAYVSDLGIALGPVNGLTLLRALHDAGRDADMARILSDRKHPGWAHILAKGGTFTWESWTPSDREGDSLSHGWGSSALVAFQEVLLGVTPLPLPGTVDGPTFDITPPTGGVTHVAGRIPTIAGSIDAQWRRDGSHLTLELALPPNATAQVHLPAGTLGAVTEHGRPVTKTSGVHIGGAANGIVTVTVGAGSYKFRT